MLIVLTVPAILAARGYSHAQGVQAMGWFIIIFLPLTLLLALWKVPEPQVTTERDRAGLIEYLGLLKRPSVRRLLIADILIGTGPAITGALFFFYFLTIKEFESAQANLLLLGYFLGAFAGGPVWMRIAYRFGKHTTLAFAALAYAAIQIGVFIMPAGNFAVSAVLMFLAGLPFSAGPFLLRAMMADIGDEELLTSGKDRTGLLYAVLTGTVKIGSALAVFVTYQGLEMVGFDAKSGPNNPQTALTGAAGVLHDHPRRAWGRDRRDDVQVPAHSGASGRDPSGAGSSKLGRRGAGAGLQASVERRPPRPHRQAYRRR
jgi:Na+/melibiose symporter-like transporter